MAWFKLKRGSTVEARGYTFAAGVATEVPDSDEATVRKLRSHPSFEEADGPTVS